MTTATNRALVLGCGPAGLIAAHALRWHLKMEVVIVSTKRKSELFGCQYLHEPIPGLGTLPKADVSYIVSGGDDDYQKKVYGDRRLPVPASTQLFRGVSQAWDIREAYRRLWDRYEHRITNWTFGPQNIAQIVQTYDPDFTFTSVPLPSFCQAGDQHDFDFIKCWAIGDAPERGQRVPVHVPENTVQCNGTKDTGWYRAANVFGYKTVEWPGTKPKPPIEGVVEFLKPISTTCTCYPGIHRIGRMGTWKKGVLAHHVYSDVVNYVTSRRNAPADHSNDFEAV